MALGTTVDDLLGKISSLELSEWMAYAQQEPFGEERADLRAGIIASAMANTVRDPKKRSKPFTPDEFMPKFDERREMRAESRKSPEEIYGLMKTWALLHGEKK